MPREHDVTEGVELRWQHGGEAVTEMGEQLDPIVDGDLLDPGGHVPREFADAVARAV